jgi:hypothetical protein
MSGYIRTIGWLCLCLFSVFVAGADPYSAPDGDLNRDGVVNAVDLQCLVVLFDVIEGAGGLAEDLCNSDDDCPVKYSCRAGFDLFKLCLPGCLDGEVSLGQSGAEVCSDPAADDESCLGTVVKKSADFDCNGTLTNADFLFVVSLVMGKAGGAGTVDADSDGRLNFCDPDSDGDETEDVADCAPLNPAVGPCADNDSCTVDTCVDGECVFVPDTGSTCDDGESCTHGDTCADGLCSGQVYGCDDDDVCTDDSCNGDGSCSFQATTGPLCDDGNPCTQLDTCSSGLCSGQSYSCDDGEECTDDWCNGDGSCGHSNVTGSCGAGKQCQNGECVAVCQPGSHATWSGSCSSYCTNQGCNSATVYGAWHSNICGCGCCQASSGGTAKGPFGGGFSDCQLVEGGWVPTCATTCVCSQ